MLLNPRSQYPRRCPDRLLFTHPAVRISRHPPCSSDNLEALVLQTMHGNFHPTAPGHQSAPAALSASSVLSVSACGSTTPPLASSVAMSLLPPPAHPHPLSAPLPASIVNRSCSVPEYFFRISCRAFPRNSPGFAQFEPLPALRCCRPFAPSS